MVMARAESVMPWARAAATNTLKRAEPAAGISAGALPRPSRYSAITGLSNTATPSSSTRQGTLPSGLLACNEAGTSIGSQTTDRNSGGEGKSVAVSDGVGGCRVMKNKKPNESQGNRTI